MPAASERRSSRRRATSPSRRPKCRVLRRARRRPFVPWEHSPRHVPARVTGHAPERGSAPDIQPLSSPGRRPLPQNCGSPGLSKARRGWVALVRPRPDTGLIREDEREAWDERAARYKAMRRANGTFACFYFPNTHCFAHDLEVHHCRYTTFRKEPDEDLELLCPYHHDRVHAWAERQGRRRSEVDRRVLKVFRPIAEAEDHAAIRLANPDDPPPPPSAWAPWPWGPSRRTKSRLARCRWRCSFVPGDAHWRHVPPHVALRAPVRGRHPISRTYGAPAPAAKLRDAGT
jgi:hypothetical protein